MSLTTRQPTANESPDTTQGGGAVAVNSPSNTGHGSTTVAVGTPIATCRWSGFAAVAGSKTSVRLKANWTRNGTVPGGTSNAFTFEYSLNGGSSWATAFQFLNVSGPASGSLDIALTPTPQDITQIQVRDNLTEIGITANLTGSISDITLEVTTQDAQPIVLW